MTRDSHGDDVTFIRALAELLRENDLTELEVKRDFGEDFKLNVRVTRAVAPPPTYAVAPETAPQPVAAAPAPEAPAEITAGDPLSHPGVVTSPMVGTAFLQPEPGADPFVRVGSEVAAGQTLMIVEAMKTMNQIHAPHAGRVTDIIVTDGSPVEFGAPLMIIE